MILLFLLVLPLIRVAATSGSATAARVVRVGLFDSSPAKPFMRDLIDAIAAEEGWQVEYVIDTMANCLKNLKNGEIDIMTALGYSLERDKIADYSKEPVFQRWTTIFLPLSSNIRQTNDLSGKRVGILRSGQTARHFIDLIDTFGITCQIVRFNSFEEIMAALENGELDAGVTVNLFGVRFLSQYKVRASSIVFNPENNFFAVPEGRNSDLIGVLDRYLVKWKANPRSVYHEAMQRWLLPGEKVSPTLPFWAYPVLIALVAGLLLLFVWTRMLRRMVNRKTRALQQSETRLSELIELSPIGLVLRSLDGEYRSANTAFLRIVGYSLAELIQLNRSDVLMPPSPFDEVWENRDQAAGLYLGPYEMDLRHKDGQEVPVRVYSMTVKQGGEVLIWSSVEDVSMLKQAELEKDILTRQLQHTQKMEAIGALAGGVAHDFNNILAAIVGYTELALFEVQGSKSLQTKLDAILSAAMRAKELVRQILIFSRKEEGKSELLVLQNVVADACKLLRKTIPSSITIDLDFDLPDRFINAEATRIYQIVMNLCTNAYHAFNDSKGVISVSLRAVTLDKSRQKQYPQLASGDYAELVVADTGCGIDPEDLSHIFDPFFTTKEVGKGTGLGLSVVHGIVKEYAGAIAVDSSPGTGTRFSVLLPLSSGPSHREEEAGLPFEALKGNERILLVDDEAALVSLGRVTLSSFGYRVTGVTSSVKALDLFRQHPDAFDLVMTDLAMPELTGEDLARCLLEIRPDIPIIISTGYSATLTEEKLRALGIRKLLFKPLERESLLMELRGIFDDEK